MAARYTPAPETTDRTNDVKSREGAHFLPLFARKHVDYAYDSFCLETLDFAALLLLLMFVVWEGKLVKGAIRNG
jgi:hypothetical protein